MGETKIKAFFRGVKRGLVRHSPEILTGIGIAGFVTTAVLAVKATPKALSLIEKETENRRCAETGIETGSDEQTMRISDSNKLPAADTIKLVWKYYVPAAVMGLLSAACIIGGNTVTRRRNAALAAAYALSETAFREYSEKVAEIVGEEKGCKIKDEIAQKKITDNPVKQCEVIVTEDGNTRCYDTVSGRYFDSDIEKIRKAENKLNKDMRDEMSVSLNDFYYEIGLPPISVGNDLGWNIDKGYIDIYFSAALDGNEKPCIVLNYKVAPIYDFCN